MDANPHVIYETQGVVATITLNRVHVRNAVDRDCAEALSQAVDTFESDPSLKIAILNGAGGHFCSGADLEAIARGRPNRMEPDGDGPMGPTRRWSKKPVIAAISGYAVAGGLELALWCDMRVMESDAVLGVFCRRWGVPLIDGGTVRLPRMIGLSRALDLILTGRPVMADEALDMGLVNRIVPKGTALDTATELAHQIAAFPQACLLADRESAYAQWDLSVDAALRQEFDGAKIALDSESLVGAMRFTEGAGRGGRFDD